MWKYVSLGAVKQSIPEMLNLISTTQSFLFFLLLLFSYTAYSLTFPLLLLFPYTPFYTIPPSSSLSMTRNPFRKRKIATVIFEQSVTPLLSPPWDATPHFTSALTQARLRVEHQLRLFLFLQNTSTLFVVFSRAAAACKVIFRSWADTDISKSIVDSWGINSEVGKLRSNTPY